MNCCSLSCMLLGKSLMILCLVFLFYKAGLSNPPFFHATCDFMRLWWRACEIWRWKVICKNKSEPRFSHFTSPSRMWLKGSWGSLASNKEITGVLCWELFFPPSSENIQGYPQLRPTWPKACSLAHKSNWAQFKLQHITRLLRSAEGVNSDG